MHRFKTLITFSWIVGIMDCFLSRICHKKNLSCKVTVNACLKTIKMERCAKLWEDVLHLGPVSSFFFVYCISDCYNLWFKTQRVYVYVYFLSPFPSIPFVGIWLKHWLFINPIIYIFGFKGPKNIISFSNSGKENMAKL